MASRHSILHDTRYYFFWLIENSWSQESIMTPMYKWRIIIMYSVWNFVVPFVCFLSVLAVFYVCAQHGEFETTFISNVSYLSLGAVVQKIVKPMGQVFTIQDVEAVSSITFILTTTLYKLCVHFLWCFRGFFNHQPHLQALFTSPHLREKAEKLNNAHACLFYFFWNPHLNDWNIFV